MRLMGQAQIIDFSRQSLCLISKVYSRIGRKTMYLNKAPSSAVVANGSWDGLLGVCQRGTEPAGCTERLILKRLLAASVPALDSASRTCAAASAVPPAKLPRPPEWLMQRPSTACGPQIHTGKAYPVRMHQRACAARSS